MEDGRLDGDDYGAKLGDGMGAADDKNKISNKDLAYVFLQNRDNFPSKPYYEDGNPEMYTKENMEKRNSLKKNDIVADAIQDFMQEFKKNAQGNITKDEYIRVFINVGMILRPGIDADDLQKIIKEDFENDSQDRLEEKTEEERNNG